jgi:hypothetical protein
MPAIDCFHAALMGRPGWARGEPDHRKGHQIMSNDYTRCNIAQGICVCTSQGSRRPDGLTHADTQTMLGAFLRHGSGMNIQSVRAMFRRIGGYDNVYGFTRGSEQWGGHGLLAKDPTSALFYLAERGLDYYGQGHWLDRDQSPLPETVVYMTKKGKVVRRPLSTVPGFGVQVA